jgi:cell division protein FtsB
MPVKKIVFFVFIIFSLFIINDFLHSIYSLWQKSDLLDRAKRTLSTEKKKNIELKNQLKFVTQPQFIEEEARNKLFLVKPGEGIVVVAPTDYLQASDSTTVKPIDTRSNWRQWWETFFGS